MQYGLSVKWHNSCGRQKDRKTNRRSSVFFARPKNPYVKKTGFFVRYTADEKGPFVCQRI